MTKLTSSKIIDFYRTHVKDVKALANGWFSGLCPLHADKNASFNFNPNGGGYNCHGCGKSGSLKEFCQSLGLPLPFTSSPRRTKGKIVQTYDYVNEKGTLLFQTVRLEPKDFQQRRPDGQGGWIWNLEGVERILYNLPAVIQATDLIIIEGEKDNGNLKDLGLVATTCPMGAGKWRPEYNKHLAGKHVAIIPDNDTPGRDHAIKVAQSLAGIAASIKIINLEGLPEKGDISDWIEQRKKTEKTSEEIKIELEDIIDATKEYVPQPETQSSAPQNKVADSTGFTMSDKFVPRLCTNEIRSNHNFFCEGRKGLLWKHDQKTGLWRPNGEEFIELYFRMLTSSIDNSLKRKNIIAEIIADVRGCTLSLDGQGMPGPKLNLIPFKDCVYDLDNDTFRKHDALDYFTFQLPWNYNPHATCPFLDDVINSFLPPDERDTLWELLAYCLYRSYPYQKFFMLTGAGSNGKSTYLSILSRMIGFNNLSSVSLHDIQNQRFAAASLMSKHANIAGEMTYDDIKNADLLKQLCGGDTIRADRKFLSALSFINHAKLIFATNSIPQTRDSSDAFHRRAFLIQFPYQFEKDPGLEIKLRSDSQAMTNEFEGLVIKVITRLKRLKAQNFIFTRDMSIQDSRRIYQSLSNPMTKFIAQHIDQTRNHSDFIFKWELQKRLTEWLQLQGLNTYTSEKIGRIMKEIGIPESKRTVNGKQDRAWIGLQWKDATTTERQGRQEIHDFTTQSHRGEDTVSKPLPSLPSPPFSAEEYPQTDWCLLNCMLSESQRPDCKYFASCPKLAASAGAR